MCFCNESNPNNVPISSFTINMGNDHNEILYKIEDGIKNSLKQMENMKKVGLITLLRILIGDTKIYFKLFLLII